MIIYAMNFIYYTKTLRSVRQDPFGARHVVPACPLDSLSDSQCEGLEGGFRTAIRSYHRHHHQYIGHTLWKLRKTQSEGLTCDGCSSPGSNRRARSPLQQRQRIRAGGGSSPSTLIQPNYPIDQMRASD